MNDHLVVDDIGDGPAVLCRLSFEEVNSCKWHSCSFRPGGVAAPTVPVWQGFAVVPV